jgi:protein-L-isoaspartate(D-aspartate) O-methyltransferase
MGHRSRSGWVRRWQLGAIGHGPTGHQLAGRIVDQINAWDRDRTRDPALFAYLAGQPFPSYMVGKIITKTHINLLMQYQ